MDVSVLVPLKLSSNFRGHFQKATSRTAERSSREPRVGSDPTVAFRFDENTVHRFKQTLEKQRPFHRLMVWTVRRHASLLRASLVAHMTMGGHVSQKNCQTTPATAALILPHVVAQEINGQCSALSRSSSREVGVRVPFFRSLF